MYDSFGKPLPKGDLEKAAERFSDFDKVGLAAHNSLLTFTQLITDTERTGNKILEVDVNQSTQKSTRA